MSLSQFKVTGTRARELAVGGVVTVIAAAGLSLVDRWWLIAAGIPVILLGFHYRKKLAWLGRAAVVGLTLALLLISSGRLINLMRVNIAAPPEWDFLTFWLHGSVAARGLNFYQPEHNEVMAQSLNVSDGFRQEAVLGGFRYPPPTMFLFLPLAAFDISTGLALWYVVQVGFLLLDVGLLWRLFLHDSGAWGLLLTATLTFALAATRSTFAYAQTNFISLAMLLLYWRNRQFARGGLWFGLGILVKPLMALLLLYVVLRRRWRVIGGFVSAIAVVAVLSVLVFGLTTNLSFFSANPNAQMPGYVYTESVNQSLLATVLRVLKIDPDAGSPLMNPWYLASAALVVGATGWALIRVDAQQDEWALALTVPMALLVYPATLDHYSVLLLAPFLWLCAQRRTIAGGVWGVTALISIEYGLISISSGQFAFVANALCWLVLLGIGIGWLSQKAGKSNDVSTPPLGAPHS